MTTSPSVQAGRAETALHAARGVPPQHAPDRRAGAGADIAFGDAAAVGAASHAL